MATVYHAKNTRSMRVLWVLEELGVKAEIAMPRIFWGQVSLLGSTMGNASEFEAVLRAINRGMRPTIDRTYPLAEVQQALEHLDSAEQFGKVVLSIS